MENIKLDVEGMTCGHCTGTIESSLKEIAVEAKANVETKSVEVSFDSSEVSLEKIKEIITEEGYEVK